MLDIPGYVILEKIHEGQKLVTYRGQHMPTQKQVLITAALDEADRFLLTTGYEITRQLDPELVVTPIDLETKNRLNFLILDDFGAVPLSRFVRRPWCMTDVIDISIKITVALCHIHETNIIHNDINPDNLWINPETRQVKISGFGLSTRQSQPAQQVTNTNFDQYRPEYMSPEQTGRTRIPVTRATDFYSLGCTLYHLASGKLPFRCTDTLEIIHCHLARNPEMPHHINPDIPEAFSKIIMKLLRKNPEDRYQSCAGLGNDLKACLTMLAKNNVVPCFQPGQFDAPLGLVFSKKLYGREKETKKLIQALKDEREDGFPLILVSGAAGMGKSVLVEQALKQINPNAYVVKGKHDRMSSQGAVQSALESVILQILGEGKKSIEKWKDGILKALGNNTRLMIDFVPMLEFIVGRQPAVMELPAFESDIRLNIVFRKFIETIASKEYPLILFLDDLQWIEPETIRIIETIASRPIKGFCMICAYRENEIDRYHAFTRIVNKIKTNRLPILEIPLAPLDKTSRNRWMYDLFSKSAGNCRSFSDLVFEKAGGNPFFIKLFLEYLYQIKLLYQVPDHSWQWNLNHIHALPATENLGYFMTNKVYGLGSPSIELLKIASCLGSSFPAKTLKLAVGRSENDFGHALEPLLDKGLMIQAKANLSFSHDIIRESEYSMMPEQERMALHLRTGRKMLRLSPENEINDQIVNITEHMNVAKNILSQTQERVELAFLNLRAGQKKMELLSLEAADRYFQTGITLLPADAWATHYTLSLSLFSQRCEVLYVLGKTAEAEQLFHQVLDHAELPDHLLRIFVAKSMYLMQSYKPREVIDTGLEILSKLGFKISKKFNRFLLLKEILGLKKQMLGKDINDILLLPVITDSRQDAIIRILFIIIQAGAFFGNPLVKIAVLKAMRFVLKHGITPHAAYIFSLYGSMVGHLSHDLKKGYAFGKLATQIVEKLNAKKQGILTHHLLIPLSINCKGKTKYHIDQLSQLLKKSLNSGLYMNMFNLHVMYFFLHFISGTRLGEIEKQMLDSRKDILERNQPVWIHYLDLLFQVVQTLMGKDKKIFLLDTPTDIFNSAIIQEWEKTNTVSTIADTFLFLQIISYFLQGSQASLAYAKKGAPYFITFLTLPCQMAHKFFFTLALLKQFDAADFKTRQAYFRQIRKNHTFFKMIYNQAPENNPHMYFLIKAEIARIKNQYDNAVCFYEKAMAASKESGYLHVEAICCELAAIFFLGKNQVYVAKTLMIRSCKLYKAWGVFPKCRDLENQFSEWVADHPLETMGAPPGHEFKDMDIYSVLKASQEISKEIKPKNLMQRLIRLILENSGAQRAFLLLYSDKQLKIEAFAQTLPDSVKIPPGMWVEKAGHLLAGAIAYSVFISRESIILDNASIDDRFGYDPYIIQDKPMSILCAPVAGKNIQGVLYLENNLIMGAFTKERLRILDILIAQVVISIENARLYEKLRTAIKKQVLSNKKIHIHQIQLKRMSSQLARAEERERKTIADDLHDSVTQSLAMSLSFLKNIHALNHKENAPKMTGAIKLLEQSLSNIRSLTFQLSSPILYDVGLEPALEWLCEDFFRTHGLQIRFVNSIHPLLPLDEITRVLIYRAVRELLINIVKHAKTQNAVLAISVQNACFTIDIEDNGIGFDPDKNSKTRGFGLFSISERMGALKGRIDIESAPGKGTRITLQVPISKN